MEIVNKEECWKLSSQLISLFSLKLLSHFIKKEIICKKKKLQKSRVVLDANVILPVAKRYSLFDKIRYFKK